MTASALDGPDRRTGVDRRTGARRRTGIERRESQRRTGVDRRGGPTLEIVLDPLDATDAGEQTLDG